MTFKSYFRNCLAVKEEDGWLKPVRLTERQLENYKDNQAKMLRALCTSGICLAFRTDATVMTFNYRITELLREWGGFDVYIDGVYTYMKEIENFKEGTIRFDFPEGRKHITIYLPNLLGIQFKNFELNAPAEEIPDSDTFLLCLGDSITQGMLSVRPSFTLPVLLSRYLDCDMLNMGVGGEIFGTDYLVKIPREPDIITLSLGCNDWTVIKSLESFKDTIRKFVDKLAALYRCRNIHGIVPVWRSDDKENKNSQGISFEQVRSAITEVYGEYGYINTIDGYQLTPHIGEFFGDGGDLKAHPNEEGFLYYAFNLVKHMKK